ncbi:LysR family transcriptional regulator [Streptomyces sp. NBC_00268]|uniref:LysR family transcriptional regulator n=1 Tax=Streptomyces sp. NBC_00268 TaxID=2975695 RepID=UPI002254FFFE|nr:LysR family transcriptional regulator [Streptomyces sp. NBC_00268]MCX5182994.1 LysR family transcriptional regulator [Streptomyces sp. NBC_00268]
MGLDLEMSLLRAFVTCARSGSISRAAAALGHSQPALSQQLRKLERSIGDPLLHRSATGVSLTRAGETLLPYAERILALSAQAVTATGQTVVGHCGVGLIEDLTAAPLAQALADFARMHPQAAGACRSSTPSRTADAAGVSPSRAPVCPLCRAPSAPGWAWRPYFPPRSSPVWRCAACQICPTWNSLVRRPGTDGDLLVDAVEDLLKSLI